MASAVDDDGAHLPLRGVVLCCTSIPPDTRDQIASIVKEMGAEHKLDLTSDVTHMIVGELSTPKYKYVAKEREDVKCLQIDWIYAVREQFLSGESVALNELEQKFQVQTFWGLVICITGFEDPDQRKEMEVQIAKHGGEYRGDLRKDCTHLICFSPAGAKYSSAKAWGIHTVSIEWLSMSIQRGLVLDEEYFKPTMLPTERGRGAWKRRQLSRVDSLKRENSESQTGGARKLRRTASARFSSENVWGDIVSAPSPALSASDSFAIAMEVKPTARPDSIPAGGQLGRTLSRSESTVRTHGNEQTTGKPLESAVKAGILSGKKFLIHGFDERRTKLLEQHLRAQDALAYRGSHDFCNNSGALLKDSSFVIVPHTMPPSLLSLKEENPTLDLDGVEIVTELWLEKCLHERQYIYPSSCVIFKPFRHPVKGFQNLSVSCTGFEGVDLMHISKTLNLLGATYQEGLNSSASGLLCKDGSLSRPKVRHAIQWKIPVLDAQWLWDSVATGMLRDYSGYYSQSQLQGTNPETMTGNRPAEPLEDSKQPRNKQLLGRSLKQASEGKMPPELMVRDSFSAGANTSSNNQSQLEDGQATSAGWQRGESLPVTEPLQEVSPNIPRPSSRSPGKREILQSIYETQKSRDDTITSALTSLLEIARQQPGSPTRKKRQLLGRARSDLSTRSLGSRADSVDSMNTDGVGTPLEPAFRYSPSKPRVQAAGWTGSSRGSKLQQQQQHHHQHHQHHQHQQADSLTAELLLNQEELEEQERQLAEAEETPVMTQVGYDDTEAGIWRERLTRKMTGTAGAEPTSPEVERELEAARRRNVLKDEGGESVSMRTRHNRM